jgi:hypothetical protein
MKSNEKRSAPLLSNEVADIREEFQLLADEWIRASEFLSSPTQIAMLWPYQRIIGLGRAAIPLILRELAKEPRQWFWALQAITGEDPVEEPERGNVRRMAEAWLQWGKEHGHVWFEPTVGAIFS